MADYTITCNECGYSEAVPQSRLSYEEGKPCPRCSKGKMYWVTPAEEARRREFWMPQERKISPYWLIPVGLLLGVGGALGLAYAIAGAAPPTVYTCPHCGAEFDTEEELLAHIELEHPGLPPPALANLYGVVTDAETGAPLANVSVQLWSPDGVELLLSTTTDSGGYYSMANISPGSYLIRLEKEGYEAVVSDIVLVEGNNDLNVGMVSIAVPPFTFSDVRAEKVIMYDAPAWETMNFFCTITNPSLDTITRTINVMVRWADGSPAWQWSFELTLDPGESYDFSWYGNTYGQRDPDAYNGPLVAKRQRVCMWLEDEEGNKSAEGCVTGSG